jgi:hypothetical protein
MEQLKLGDEQFQKELKALWDDMSAVAAKEYNQKLKDLGAP